MKNRALPATRLQLEAEQQPHLGARKVAQVEAARGRRVAPHLGMPAERELHLLALQAHGRTEEQRCRVVTAALELTLVDRLDADACQQLAEQQAGQLERAVSHLEQAQDVWPQERPGLSQEQLRWFRQAEKYHLLLVRHRWAQARRPAQSQPSLDPLFVKDGQPVRYLGDNGQYEAGKIAASERAKLPPDAVAIVQQLLIWLPDDTLLYWQYGELLNADGDVTSAAQVFDDCRGRRRLDADELKQHRQFVTEAAQAKSQESGLSSEESDKTPASGSGSSWLPDRNKLWAAGTIFALIFVVLIYFQVREIRRRRRAEK